MRLLSLTAAESAANPHEISGQLLVPAKSRCQTGRGAFFASQPAPPGLAYRTGEGFAPKK